MDKVLSLFLCLFFITGCAAPSRPTTDASQSRSSSEVTLPIAQYAERLRVKAFGEFIQDRFQGYHVGDDIEYGDIHEEVPVVAMADGVVTHRANVAGYGGVIVLKHVIGGNPVHALYGHLDISSTTIQGGDTVGKGQFLAHLGDDQSKETDGERKHLHFSLYRDGAMRLSGYEFSEKGVARWHNPYQFFLDHNGTIKKSARTFEPKAERGGDIFNIQFMIPEGWEVEYVPSLKALNLFTLAGEGSARQRSKIFINPKAKTPGF